jgi:hypothetical protein
VTIFYLKVSRKYSDVLQLEKNIFYLDILCSINSVLLVVDNKLDSLTEEDFSYELAGVDNQLGKMYIFQHFKVACRAIIVVCIFKTF